MGMPAARVTDMHLCPMFDGPKPHVGGPILPPCQVNVLTGGLQQARVGDKATCASAPDIIVQGSFTVLVGGMPAARMFDTTAHGGKIMFGMINVLIGDAGSAPSGSLGQGMASSKLALEQDGDEAQMGKTLIEAAREGTPFCEQCSRSN